MTEIRPSTPEEIRAHRLAVATASLPPGHDPTPRVVAEEDFYVDEPEKPCNGCGATDTDPKHHLMGRVKFSSAGGVETYHLHPSYHYDCVPDDLDEVLSVNPIHTAAKAAARGGTHGRELHEYIHTLGTFNGTGATAQDAIDFEDEQAAKIAAKRQADGVSA